ncbi:hypothetical protein LINPERPRIM_LOCUS11999, partial [Linum perenne]
VAEWSKAPDSSSGPRKRAWVQIPLLTISFFSISYFHALTHNKSFIQLVIGHDKVEIIFFPIETNNISVVLIYFK